MSEEIPAKTVIRVNPRKTIVDAFAKPDVHLFLPTDSLGNLTCPTKAVRFECWKPAESSVKRQALADIFCSNMNGLRYSLLREGTDHEYSQLPRNISMSSLMVLNNWLQTLERYPKGDPQRFEVVVH